MERTRFSFEPAAAEEAEEKRNRRKRRVNVWACVLCALLAAAFSVLLTSVYYVHRFAELEPVSEAIELVKKNYYFFDKDTEQSMVTGALKGLSSYLGDKYAEYYTQEEYQEFVSSNSGNFIGITVL